MGVVPVSPAGLGLEAAGIVSSIGSNVQDFAVGDHVFTFQLGCFSSKITMAAKQCVKIPDELSFEDASTMGCVFATAIYALIHVGRLERKQVYPLWQSIVERTTNSYIKSVLIHSATGGVGIAAIQISKMLGAEIYATVGSDEKVQYLISTFGIPRDRIFNSRDSSFAPDLLRATNGKGVDVVLNSLSGELLHASWECVAGYGTLVELGIKDLIGDGKLNLNGFLLNRNYCGIDGDYMCRTRPELIVK